MEELVLSEEAFLARLRDRRKKTFEIKHVRVEATEGIKELVIDLDELKLGWLKLTSCILPPLRISGSPPHEGKVPPCVLLDNVCCPSLIFENDFQEVETRTVKTKELAFSENSDSGITTLIINGDYGEIKLWSRSSWITFNGAQTDFLDVRCGPCDGVENLYDSALPLTVRNLIRVKPVHVYC